MCPALHGWSARDIADSLRYLHSKLTRPGLGYPLLLTSRTHCARAEAGSRHPSKPVCYSQRTNTNITKRCTISQTLFSACFINHNNHAFFLTVWCKPRREIRLNRDNPPPGALCFGCLYFDMHARQIKNAGWPGRNSKRAAQFNRSENASSKPSRQGDNYWRHCSVVHRL